MRKSFKYKLYTSKKNFYLSERIRISGVIYNHCIALHKRYYRLTGKFLNSFKLKTHLTKLKRLRRFSFFKIVPSQAIQDIAERIDKAYKLFFGYIQKKSSVKCAPPSFKKVVKYKSFTLKQAGFKLLGGNKIRIGDKVFKFSKSREIQGKIKTLTIKKDALGDFYLIFSCDEVLNPLIKPLTGKSAGFDFGLKTFLVSSDETENIESPQVFFNSLPKLRKACKSLSSKKRGSSNRKKARLVLAKVHKKISDTRRDFHFKLANQLVSMYDYLFFEDLNLQGMKKLWGRKVSDLGFSDFANILKFKCQEHGKAFVTIGRFFPSSKMCGECGSINSSLSISDREWVCPTCGCVLDRDKNAAINILREGIRLV